MNDADRAHAKASCCPPDTDAVAGSSRYRRALWIALAVNAVMFVIELGASVSAESVALLADAVDFAGDAGNYGMSLGAIALGTLWQSRAALFKGLCMAGYGAFVLALAGWSWLAGSAPEPITMGVVGGIALAANLGVTALLFAYREGNADMRSVWLCTRNDSIGNIAVLIAALGVFGTGTRWPDLIVAAVIASFAVSGGVTTIRSARAELRPGQADSS